MSTVAAPLRKLSLGTKLAYGTGDLGPAMVSMIKGFFLLNFLINVAGLAPGRAGLVLLLAKIWDAVNDPIVGTLTDRTRTRWGRRRPWLLFGSIPFGIAFFLHFVVPPLSDLGLFFYYVGIAILLDAGFTAVNVPYAALTPELSESEQDRTDLNMYRFSFSVLGGLVAAVMYNTIVNQVYAADLLTGNMVQGVIVAIVIIVSNIIVFANTSESTYAQADSEEEDPLPFFDGLKIALSSRPFLYVAAIYMLTWLSVQFVQSLILFFFRDWIGGDPGGEFTLLLFGLQISIFLFILVWGSLTPKLGRRRVFMLGVPVWMAAQVALYFLQPGQTTLTIIIAIVAGIGVSLAFLIPWSLLPDAVDYDELLTGRRREGIFYGFFVFLQKMGIALGLFVQGQVLEWAGYISAEGSSVVPQQPESALFAMRMLVVWVPIVLLALSLWLVQKYPITREKLLEIQAELSQRRP